MDNLGSTRSTDLAYGILCNEYMRQLHADDVLKPELDY